MKQTLLRSLIIAIHISTAFAGVKQVLEPNTIWHKNKIKVCWGITSDIQKTSLYDKTGWESESTYL